MKHSNPKTYWHSMWILVPDGMPTDHIEPNNSRNAANTVSSIVTEIDLQTPFIPTVPDDLTLVGHFDMTPRLSETKLFLQIVTKLQNKGTNSRDTADLLEQQTQALLRIAEHALHTTAEKAPDLALFFSCLFHAEVKRLSDSVANEIRSMTRHDSFRVYWVETLLIFISLRIVVSSGPTILGSSSLRLYFDLRKDPKISFRYPVLQPILKPSRTFHKPLIFTHPFKSLHTLKNILSLNQTASKLWKGNYLLIPPTHWIAPRLKGWSSIWTPSSRNYNPSTGKKCRFSLYSQNRVVRYSDAHFFGSSG